MDYPKYNTNNSKPKKNYDNFSAGAGNYQSFLEYLEKSGNAAAFRRKLMKEQSSGNKLKEAN